MAPHNLSGQLRELLQEADLLDVELENATARDLPKIFTLNGFFQMLGAK